ncbi:phenolic acid decarboxylase [Streptomyces sp. SM13]|uniref:phenolic acid decarboxylase n=1 Tax=Streptomyces sp. SM13 TaxID=1983803 RepID=UPI000CD5BB6B|nr:phenolic acid decarboxylase [Streptomyces sp. SM13]MCD9904406.1 phenolic acid decarboxylase [Streptomyces sp. MT29]
MGTRFPTQDPSFLVGLHVVYEYSAGIRVELYVRNPSSVDYRVLEGPVAERWVTGQEATVASLGAGTGILSWAEATGSTVSLVINPDDRWVYGSAFFAKWVEDQPHLTTGHQNENLRRILDLRNEGPIAPHSALHQFAKVIAMEYRDTDDDRVMTPT